MPNFDYQRHSFLGGEVSPSLYERADMDKFGKWFAKAENIRFGETGAFRNRCGFTKVANTKFNQSGQVIKLMSFSFNDEESFLVELGPGYARFYKDGNPVMDGDEPYELATQFDTFSEVDIKYAQAGDTIFLVHPTYGIYELARLLVDGTKWEFKRFNTSIFPMKEENENKSSTVSLSYYTGTSQQLSIANSYSDVYEDVEFTFDGSILFTLDSASKTEIFNSIQQAVSGSYTATLSGSDVLISPVNPVVPVPVASISYNCAYYVQDNVSSTVTGSTLNTSVTVPNSWTYLDRVYTYYKSNIHWKDSKGNTHSDKTSKTFDVSVAANTIPLSLTAARGVGAFSEGYEGSSGGGLFPGITVRRTHSSDGVQVDDLSSRTLEYSCKCINVLSGNENDITNGTITLRITGRKKQAAAVQNTSTAVSGQLSYYEMTSNSDIMDKVNEGDCILVKNYMDSQIYSGRFGTGTQEWISGANNGGWRMVCTGAWAGKGTIEYSIDNKKTWTSVYEWESTEKDIPMNPNLSNAVLSDDSVFFRVKLNVTNGNININFATDAYSINSYYKILNIVDSNTAIVDCIKNDVGEISSSWQWRLPAFSNKEGWPQTVAFYQNRLFFGKDYILYGSKTDDFWDFYEPVTVKADDPISMSLLSQKVNNIRNLVTQKSFFTFTAGGEFGIGSEAALTQSDKYLKSFSSNGSAPCLPVLIGDKVLFVDKSYNSVRALQYSLESDGYEAPDITLALHSLLKDEKIISTELIYEEKEALFLSNTGTIWVLKYIPDQNVLSWSHWKHAFGKITNICVVPNGAKHVLYIAVESGSSKWIEKMDENEYMDTVESFDATESEKVQVTGLPGSEKYLFQGNHRYVVTVDEDGYIDVPKDHTLGFKVGSSYVSTATLLTPVVQTSEYSRTNYEVKRPFKVFFYYLNSYGFKVGVKEYEKMEIEWQPIGADIDDEFNLTSGKKSVLIPSRFEGSSMVSFVQEEPYPMEIADTLIQTDYGGK